MIKINLKNIEYFLIIAKELNITKAAEKINISQQGLSAKLKSLEEELGTTLFFRKPKFRLTPAGEQLVHYGKQFMNTQLNLMSSLSDIIEDSKAKLRFGISRLRSDAFFPLIWEEYYKIHPNVKIEIVNDNSEQLEELLNIGEIDLYMGIDVPDTYKRNKIPLSKEQIWCCINHELLKRFFPNSWQYLLNDFKENGVDPKKLLNMPFVSLRKDNGVRKIIDLYLSNEIQPNYILECDQHSLVYELSIQGYGVGFISPVIIVKYKNIISSETSTFHLFPVIDSIPDYTSYLIYNSDYTLPSYAIDFISVTKEILYKFNKSLGKDFN